MNSEPGSRFEGLLTDSRVFSGWRYRMIPGVVYLRGLDRILVDSTTFFCSALSGTFYHLSYFAMDKSVETAAGDAV